jgi:hypothetical protein
MVVDSTIVSHFLDNIGVVIGIISLAYMRAKIEGFNGTP